MKSHKPTRNIRKRLIGWVLIVGTLLLIPLVANAPWTFGDFVFAGIVLFGCAATYEYVTRNMNDKWHRIAVAIAILFFIFLVIGWAAAGPPDEAARAITR